MTATKLIAKSIIAVTKKLKGNLHWYPLPLAYCETKIENQEKCSVSN